MDQEQKKMFQLGVILSLGTGIFTNIFVTAMYRFIDGNKAGNNFWTMLIGFVGTVVLICLIYKKIKA